MTALDLATQIETTNDSVADWVEAEASISITDEGMNYRRDRPEYNATPEADGMYHCVYSKDLDCGHEPTMFKAIHEYVHAIFQVDKCPLTLAIVATQTHTSRLGRIVHSFFAFTIVKSNRALSQGSTTRETFVVMKVMVTECTRISMVRISAPTLVVT